MSTPTAAVPDLVRAAGDGDLDAFGRLVDRFQAMALGYAHSLLGDQGLAEDACQEAFMEAYIHLGQVRDPAAFAGWFRRVLIKHADRQRRRRLLYQELVDVPGATDPLAALIDAEERRQVRAQVAELPARLRECVVGFYGEGYSVAEIAGFLEVSEGAVRKRLFDARRRLRECMPPPAPRGAAARDAVEMLLAARLGDARRVAAVVARRPDLVNAVERWIDPEAVRAYGSLGEGLTALQRAVFMGHQEVVRVLLDAGASQLAGAGLRPLDLAVLQDDAPMTQLLIERGASYEVPDGVLTPLHRAAMRGHAAAAQRLLELGFPAGRRDGGGRTAADWARLKGHPGLAALIEEYMR